MVSSDPAISDIASDVFGRILDYSKRVDFLTVLLFSEKQKKMISRDNLLILPVSSFVKIFIPIKALMYGRSIAKPDLITSQDPFETGIVGYILAYIHKIPFQIQLHTDMWSPAFRRESLKNLARFYVGKILLPRASCVRVVHAGIKMMLTERLGIKENKITVLPIYVPTSSLQNAPVKDDLHKKYPQFDFIILMASRLTKEKNISLALSAMQNVLKEFPNAGLVIVGEGPLHGKLRKLIKELSLEKNVFIESWQADMASYYKTANLFLITSNYEGYGRTIIEALSVGLPVISTDVGVAREAGARVLGGYGREGVAEVILESIRNPKPGRLSQYPYKNNDHYLQEFKKSLLSCL